jgi:hypothetical protein
MHVHTKIHIYTFTRPQAQGVLQRLAASVSQLPLLQKLNGSRTVSSTALASSVASSGVVDLSGSVLGPIAAAALLCGLGECVVWCGVVWYAD